MNPLVLLAMLFLVVGMLFRLVALGIAAVLRLGWQGCARAATVGTRWVFRRREGAVEAVGLRVVR